MTEPPQDLPESGLYAGPYAGSSPAAAAESRFDQRPPIWTMRTVAAASALTVALAAGGGAALAALSEGSSGHDFGPRNGPTGQFTPGNLPPGSKLPPVTRDDENGRST